MMKRRIGILAAAGLIASLGTITLQSPATANSDGVCAGQGVATLSTGFGSPGLTAKNTANFVFNLSVGNCTNKVNLTATGTVNGWCGLSTGKGTTDNGHHFAFQSTGGTLVVSGELTGQVSAVPDPTHTGSCTNKTATRFIITGSVHKHECAGDTETSDTTHTKNKDANVQVMTCV